MRLRFFPVFVFPFLVVGCTNMCSEGDSKVETSETADLSSSEEQTGEEEPTIEEGGIEEMTTQDGETATVDIVDIVVGEGAVAEKGSSVTVHYTGTLEDGTKFDSSLDRQQPFTFELASGMVIKGWDIGVEGMKVGGKRKLTIPGALAYGDKGVPGTIPANATLIFEVELLGVE
jgi:FKBP-type peptidyl-prolyl cis-trans isomerase